MLEGMKMIDDIAFVRTAAVAPIAMRKSMALLSAGRERMPEAEQALCFLAGANSIFTGDKLLTTAMLATTRTRTCWRGSGLSRSRDHEPMRASEPAH